jgi:hypothetical protein
MGIEITDEQGAYLMAKIRSRCIEDGDCLMWPGSSDSKGIPTIRVGRKIVSVRKLVLMRAGKWIDGLNAANTCGRPGCVAEEHSAALNRSELTKLAVERTQYHLRPQRNAKIAAAQRASNGVLNADMRAEIMASDESQHVLAARFGVSQHAVSDCLRGRTYRDYASPFAGLGAR